LASLSEVVASASRSQANGNPCLDRGAIEVIETLPHLARVVANSPVTGDARSCSACASDRSGRAQRRHQGRQGFQRCVKIRCCALPTPKCLRPVLRSRPEFSRLASWFSGVGIAHVPTGLVHQLGLLRGISEASAALTALQPTPPGPRVLSCAINRTAAARARCTSGECDRRSRDQLRSGSAL